MIDTATIRTLDNRQLAIVSARTFHDRAFNRGHWVADVVSEEFTCDPAAVAMDYAADVDGAELITVHGQPVAHLFFA